MHNAIISPQGVIAPILLNYDLFGWYAGEYLSPHRPMTRTSSNGIQGRIHDFGKGGGLGNC